MTLVEALKTGKPFKRAGWTYPLSVDNGSRFIDCAGDHVCLDVKDILTDDWCVEERSGDLTHIKLIIDRITSDLALARSLMEKTE